MTAKRVSAYHAGKMAEGKKVDKDISNLTENSQVDELTLLSIVEENPTVELPFGRDETPVTDASSLSSNITNSSGSNLMISNDNYDSTSLVKEITIPQHSKITRRRRSNPETSLPSKVVKSVMPQPLNVKNRGSGSDDWTPHGTILRKAYIRLMKGIAYELDISLYDVIDTAIGEFLKRQGKL